MTHYLAANGLPFTDRDAAEIKAHRMHAESGARFEIVKVEGGFAVECDPDDHAAFVDAATWLDEALCEGAQRSDTSNTNEATFVISLRPAWRAQLVGFVLMLLGAVLVIAPTWPIALFSMETVYAMNERMPYLWDDITLLGLATILVGAVTTLWKRYYQHSVITDVAVMQSVGILFHRHVSEINMANIHVVDVKQPSLFHMLLNFGTVELSTPGSDGADVAIVDVVSPRRIAAFVRDQVDLTRVHRPDNSLHFRSST